MRGRSDKKATTFKAKSEEETLGPTDIRNHTLHTSGKPGTRCVKTIGKLAELDTTR